MASDAAKTARILDDLARTNPYAATALRDTIAGLRSEAAGHRLALRSIEAQGHTQDRALLRVTARHRALLVALAKDLEQVRVLTGPLPEEAQTLLTAAAAFRAAYAGPQTARCRAAHHLAGTPGTPEGGAA
jgi:hypothetical protein